MNDVLNDALSNLEHDNYELSYKGYENRQADVALIRAALAAQPAASAEPSDTNILAEWAFIPNSGDMRVDLVAFARALLSRYGRPAGDAQPAVWVAADTLNSPHPTCISSLAYMSQLDRDRGREYVPLYAAPVAAQKADDARDAARWRWFTDDHNDPRVRADLRALFDRLPVMSYSAACAAIDAALAAQASGQDDSCLRERITELMDTNRRQQVQIKTLEAQIHRQAQDAADAARYRWLRDREIPEVMDLWHQNPARIDAAIDAAMKASA